MCEHKIELMTMHDPSNKCNITWIQIMFKTFEKILTNY
jgi:hypothetical protein